MLGDAVDDCFHGAGVNAAFAFRRSRPVHSDLRFPLATGTLHSTAGLYQWSCRCTTQSGVPAKALLLFWRSASVASGAMIEHARLYSTAPRASSRPRL